MEEIARVYAEALFESAKEAGKLDVIKEQLDQFADALSENRELQLFLFSPYFSSAEKQEGLSEGDRRGRARAASTSSSCSARSTGCRSSSGSGTASTTLWDEENKRLEVTVTSAVELDPELVQRIGQEIEKQTGQTVELQQRRRRGHPRRAGAAGRQQGAGRQRPQQARETSKERRRGGVSVKRSETRTNCGEAEPTVVTGGIS